MSVAPTDLVDEVRHLLLEVAMDDFDMAQAGIDALAREHGMPAVGDAMQTVVADFEREQGTCG